MLFFFSPAFMCFTFVLVKLYSYDCNSSPPLLLYLDISTFCDFLFQILAVAFVVFAGVNCSNYRNPYIVNLQQTMCRVYSFRMFEILRTINNGVRFLNANFVKFQQFIEMKKRLNIQCAYS